MGRNDEMELERDMLERIVALLLALAGLADRAAFAPGHKRCRALWALQHANVTALELIAGRSFNLAGQHWSPALVPTRYGNAPADATSLAIALRALAFLMQTMATRIRSRATWRVARTCADGSRQPGATGLAEALPAAFAAVGLCDTS